MKELLLIALFAFFTTSVNTHQKSLFFNPKESFDILSIKKSYDANSSDNDTIKCIGWNLSKEEVKKVLNESRQMSGVVWHHTFSVFRCQYIGKLIQEDKIYDFSLNAGAWFYISDGDSSAYFGSFNKQNNYLFLDGAWEEEDYYPEEKR